MRLHRLRLDNTSGVDQDGRAQVFVRSHPIKRCVAYRTKDSLQRRRAGPCKMCCLGGSIPSLSKTESGRHLFNSFRYIVTYLRRAKNLFPSANAKDVLEFIFVVASTAMRGTTAIVLAANDGYSQGHILFYIPNETKAISVNRAVG